MTNALAKKGETLKSLDRWKAEMPTEAEMLPRDKYTMFDRKAKRYRKGIHSALLSWAKALCVRPMTDFCWLQNSRNGPVFRRESTHQVSRRGRTDGSGVYILCIIPTAINGVLMVLWSCMQI